MTRLAPTPKTTPKYTSTIKNSAGKDVSCADPRAIRTLVALMDLGAVNGGAACHWGGPAAMAECWSALHQIMFQKENWHQSYNFVNDIGHAENGLYALRALYGFSDLTFNDLKKFRSIESKLTGHGESHLYPEGVLLSNGPLSSAVAQSQGLAMADKLSHNNRVTITTISDGACMEGEARETIAAIPGLHHANKINPYVLIISDNQTKLTGRIHDAYSMQPTFDSLDALGWEVIKVTEGNNLEACYRGIEKALELCKTRPVALVVKTTKGFGVKSTAESASGGHGFPLKPYDQGIFNFIAELWGNETPADEFKAWAEELLKKPESAGGSVKTEKVQVGVTNALNKLKKEGFPIVSISSDLPGSTGVAGFQKENPEASFDLGIAESNMVSAAAGFSKNGFIPVVDTFAAFGVTKGNLPLIMASLSECPMICMFSHTGFQDAADGASHQSLTYFSAVAAIPNVKAICLSTSYDAEVLIELAIRQQFEDKKKGHADSYVFFLGRENFVSKLDGAQATWNDDLLVSGKDGLLVACGPMVHQALQARELLKAKGKDFGVVNHYHLNSVNTDQYKKWLSSHNGVLVTVEDHQVNSGIGASLVHQLATHCLSELKSVKTLGVQGKFGQSAYLADELYAKHGIDAAGICRAVLN